MNKTIKKIIPMSMAMLFVAPMTTAYADVNATIKKKMCI